MGFVLILEDKFMEMSIFIDLFAKSLNQKP